MTRDPPGRLLAAVLPALLAAGCGTGGRPDIGAPGSAAVDAPAPAAASDDAGEPVQRAGRIVVAPSPSGTAVAAALVLPGSAREAGAELGLTLLAARTVLEQARDPLAALGASASVTCAPGAFTFTLLAPPDGWAPALDAFLAAIYRPDPEPEALERARSGLLASLRLDQASPAWQARLAPRRALHDPAAGESPWSRPPCGVPETLGSFGLADVRRAATRFRAAESTAAVVGPVAADSVLQMLRPLLGAGGLARFPAPDGPAAGRVYVERNTVTAWVSVAWPFGPHADVETLRLLGALLRDAVAPAVERPDVFHAEYEIERHGAGGALVAHVVVAPERAAWAAGALEALAAAAARGEVPRPVLERVRRRHRGLRLQELASPEARAARLARDLAFAPTSPATPAASEPRVWPGGIAYTEAAVREAASSLGRPSRAVVGPRPARAAVLP